MELYNKYIVKSDKEVDINGWWESNTMPYNINAGLKNLLLSLSEQINDDPLNDANDNLRNEHVVITCPNNPKDYTRLIAEYNELVQEEVDQKLMNLEKTESHTVETAELQFYVCEYSDMLKKIDDYSSYIIIIPENLEKLSQEQFRISSGELFKQVRDFFEDNDIKSIVNPETQELRIKIKDLYQFHADMTDKNLDTLLLPDILKVDDILTEEAMEKYKKYSEEFRQRKLNGETFYSHNDKIALEDDYEEIYKVINEMRKNGEIKFVESVHNATNLEKKIQDLESHSDGLGSDTMEVDSRIDTPPLAQGCSSDSDSKLQATHIGTHSDQLALCGTFADKKQMKEAEENIYVHRSKPTL